MYASCDVIHPLSVPLPDLYTGILMRDIDLGTNVTIGITIDYTNDKTPWQSLDVNSYINSNITHAHTHASYVIHLYHMYLRRRH